MPRPRTIPERARAAAAFLTLVGVVAGVLLINLGAWVEAAFAEIWLLLIWEACARPTVCNVTGTATQQPCGDHAFGRLRACWRPEHKRVKHRVLLAWLTRPTTPAPGQPTWDRNNHPTTDQELGIPGPTPARILLFAVLITGAAALISAAVQFTLLGQ